MTKQPEALLAFADRIEEAQGKPIAIDPQAAAELRRLYELNQELLHVIEDILSFVENDWSVPPECINKVYKVYDKATGEH